MGSDINSNAISRKKFATALPKNNAEPEMGEAMTASRQSFGRSRAKLRFTTRAPAKANTIQRRPPDISSNSSDVGSNAKLNNKRITTANDNDALIVSLLRSSDLRSFHAIV